MQTTFLWSFHYFRAFAILNIVILHIWVLPDNNTSLVNYQMAFKEWLFHDSTLYFIFISGFLVMYLKEKIRTGPYYLSKLKNVLLPYFLISMVLYILYGLIGTKTEALNFEFFKKGLLETLKGEVNFHFWYIPFITLIFLVTPLLVKLPKKFFLIGLPIILVLPMLGTRTTTEISLGQYLYFMPVYLLGMFTSIYLNEVAHWLTKSAKFLWLLLVTTFVLLGAVLFNHDYSLDYPNYIEGIFYVNRMTLSFLLLKYLIHVKHNSLPLLGKVADYSFALYFIHGSIGVFLQPRLFAFLELVNKYLWLPLSLLYTFLLILFCMIVIKLTKVIFGRHSKYLIGY